MMNTIVEQTGTNLNCSKTVSLTKSLLKKFPHLYYVCHFKTLITRGFRFNNSFKVLSNINL